MKTVAAILLLLIPTAATAAWRVEKDKAADTYGVYEDGQRRGTLRREGDGAAWGVHNDGGGRMGWAEMNTSSQSFDIGGVRQDPGLPSLGVYDLSGNRLGTLHPEASAGKASRP